MIGKTISHYKIIKKLGAGGMGVVYKAEDTKLKRTVALKFLPPELTRDVDAKERFIREAQAASSLDHPNICNIHEINETEDGQLFIVMACYEGQTLKQKIGSGQLSVDETIAIAVQIAQGLERAHEEGIVHRDIKPANIIITDRGEVKILDFGLAKLAGQAQLTKDTSTLGTVAYMSPEQVSGKEVDQRTDIWSLGVVLYEMLTGELPFKGDYEQAVIYAILNEEPNFLEDIKFKYFLDIEKLLAKEPSNRFQNCKEVLIELDNIKSMKPEKRKSKSKRAFIFSGIAVIITLILFSVLFFLPTEEDKKSIISLAVLPFTNIKSDPETNYLGDALAAEIIKDLTYLRNITVLPFSTVSEIEKKEDLQTDYTLTGNYLKEANTIRLNIELIDNDSNKMIWQESIEQAFENTFKLQDIVSEIVVDGLKINFSTDEQDHMRVDLPHNPQAYDYYLRSLSYSSDTKDDSLAIEILKKSIQIDSSYAPVYDELGFRTLRFGQGVFKIASDYGQAERYFLKALSINSDLITSLNYLSGIYTEIGEIEKAMDLAHKALDINPNNAYTHLILSYNYRYVGMLNNSKKEAEIALRIDPHNPRFRSFGHTYLYLREYKKAIEMYDLDEKSIWSLCKKSVTFLRNGQIDEAIVHANRAIEKNPKGQWGLFSSIIKAYIEGNIEKGIKMNLKWELAKPYDSETLYYIASNYGLLGETAGCVRVLRKAVEGGFFCYPFFLTDPFLDPMRDDPEFQEVLALAREKA